MAKVTIEYFGVEGSGRNVTEAKRDAGCKIEAALSGSYTPEVVAYRSNAVLVYRTPDGWYAALVAYDDKGVRDGRIHGTCYGERKEALRAARHHVAQLGWVPADGLSVPDFINDRREASDLRSWQRFQLRFRAARAYGLEHWDAHSWAGGDPTKPHLQNLPITVPGLDPEALGVTA